MAILEILQCRDTFRGTQLDVTRPLHVNIQTQ